LCHTPSLSTGLSPSTALSNQTANLFSDLLVHHMGPVLADDIFQGAAVGDEFRSAPLWGVGQRIFFLHDGRTSDLLQAIQAHSSGGHLTFAFPVIITRASEANKVIDKFNDLPVAGKQDVLNFLRSL